MLNKIMITYYRILYLDNSAHRNFKITIFGRKRRKFMKSFIFQYLEEYFIKKPLKNSLHYIYSKNRENYSMVCLLAINTKRKFF